MKDILAKIWIYLVVGIGSVFIGILIGRSNTTTSIVTKYVKGETVSTSVSIPGPERIVIKNNPILPTKHDTIWKEGKPVFIYIKVDTAKIIANYIERRYYNIKAFDDNNGKLILTPVVQYNSLDSLGIQFTPIQKVTTITKQRILIPFIQAKYNTIGYFGVGGGIFYHNVGVSASYINNLSNSGLEFGLYYKF